MGLDLCAVGAQGLGPGEDGEALDLGKLAGEVDEGVVGEDDAQGILRAAGLL